MVSIKPYYRITRNKPKSEYIPDSEFVLDKRYASNRFLLLRSYDLLEEDLKKILEFVEPSDTNESSYSHRLYELFLRSSTEFETNCKEILSANGYQKRGDLNIKDYFKINKATKLSEYKVKINCWYPRERIITPLLDWSNGSTLSWYQDYNLVKHNRSWEFSKANLGNVLKATASVLVILFAQFGEYTFNPYDDETMLSQHDTNGFWYGANSLLSVKPKRWPPNQAYEFSWNRLKTTDNPFRKYRFV